MSLHRALQFKTKVKKKTKQNNFQKLQLEILKCFTKCETWMVLCYRFVNAHKFWWRWEVLNYWLRTYDSVSWPAEPSHLIRYYTLCPACIYLLKTSSRNIRKSCEICSKLTIKTSERCLVCNVNIICTYWVISVAVEWVYLLMLYFNLNFNLNVFIQW